MASSSRPAAFRRPSRFGASVDRPLERVGCATVVGPAPLAELGDHQLPSRRTPILPELELRAPAVDLERHGGKLSHGPAIERIVVIGGTERSLGSISRE